MSDTIDLDAIDTPTVIDRLDEATYHAHRGSLSASGAKWLAPPDACPAKFQHALKEPKTSDAMDFGSVVHQLVLGTGWPVRIVDAASWLGKAAAAERDEARSRGEIPILAKDHDQAERVAAAVRADETAGPLFKGGKPEVSLFWPDDMTGVMRRARLDYLIQQEGRRTLIVDLKTARSVAPNDFGRSAADFGYHLSIANYLDGVRACGLGADPVSVFVAVEKVEPFVVQCFTPKPEDVQLGHDLMAAALRLYRACRNNNHWPGYVAGVTPLDLPGYYVNRAQEAIA